MPKPPPQRVSPDPMAGIVDRLLAQLPSLQQAPEPPRTSPARSPLPLNGAATVRRPEVAGQGQLLSMWFRVLLGLSLGVTMGWWPYDRTCGLPLFSYLAAVVMVLLAGVWAAAASWNVRSPLAHVISLVIFFYGILLTGSELLPRTGYAVQQATWTCQEQPQAPSLVLSQATPPQ